MADKKTEAKLEMEDDAGPEEDTRDIFDKALDYAPFAGMLLGGAIGRRMRLKEEMRRWQKVHNLQKKYDELRSRNQIRGLTPKAGVEMYNLEKKIQEAVVRAASIQSPRLLIKMPLGAYLGYEGGSAAKDTFQKEQSPAEKRKRKK